MYLHQAGVGHIARGDTVSELQADEIAALIDHINGLQPDSVTRPVLVYFDIIGIAWPIRCALHLKEVDYELIQISLPQWAYRNDTGEQSLKQCFKNGHVPLYVDPDVYLNQSMVIMNHIGEKLGLAGNTPAERNAVTEICAHAYDSLFHWNGLLQVVIKIGIPDDIVAARKAAFMGKGHWGIVTNGFVNHLNGFERYLDANRTGSGYFVGETLTMADLHAFNLLCNWYKAFDRERFTAEYPALEQFIQRIAAIPAVHDYIENLQEPTVWFNAPQLAIQLTSPEELEGLVD